MKKVEEMRMNMLKAGVYSLEDIEEICGLEEAYNMECDVISLKCIAEGYPAYGENYELRCEEACKYYDDRIAEIDSKYE